MAKVETSFRIDSFDTEFMFKCASWFGISAKTVFYFGEYPDLMIDVELSHIDVEHLHEFAVKHQPDLVHTFYHLVEETN